MIKNHHIRTLAQILVAAVLTSLAVTAWSNPPMVPKQGAQRAFGGKLPKDVAELLGASIPAHIERQRQLDSRYLAGSTLRKIDYFDKTLTVVRGGKTTVMDAELLGSYTPGDSRWEWAIVQREFNDPDLKDAKRKSFAAGSALIRLYGREHGIDVLREDATSVPTEDAVWYLCAMAAKISDATGVLVTVGRTTPAEGQAEGPLVKRYYLLSRPREQQMKNG